MSTSAFRVLLVFGVACAAGAAQADHIDLFYGKAMLILGAGDEAGRARITATSAGLRSATTEIRVQ